MKSLLLVLLGIAIAVGCGNDKLATPPAEPEAVLLTVVTTGSIPDPDGYDLLVDHVLFAKVSTSSETELTLQPGSHVVELAGVAGNCGVAGGTKRNLSLRGGGHTAVTFYLYCPGLGSLTVTSSTSGTSLDLNGYVLSLDGVVKATLAPNDQFRIDSLPPSQQYVVRLSSVAGNCAVSGGSSRAVVVLDGSPTTVIFTIICSPWLDDTPGEKLVVQSTELGAPNASLYLMQPNGSNVQRLTDVLGDAFSPEFSPDGNRILFLQSGVNGARLTLLDRPTRQETILPTLGVDRAVWSPDGSQIAFSRAGRIYRMNADGSAEVQLTTGNADSDPYWSPDGSRISFTREKAIYTVSPSGGTPLRVTQEGAPRASGPWSPDGKSMVVSEVSSQYCYYSYYCYTYAVSDLLVLDLVTGTEQRLTSTPSVAEWSPSWAADGQRIFFIAAPGGNQDVYLVRLGSAPVNVTVGPAREQWVSVGYVTSPVTPTSRPQQRRP